MVLELLSALPLRPEPRPVLPDRRQPRQRRQRELRRPRPARRQLLPRPPLRPGGRGRVGVADPGLFYRFQVGADLEFICIDTSIAQRHGRRALLRRPRRTAAGSRTCSQDRARAGGSRSPTIRRTAPGRSTRTPPAWSSGSCRCSSGRRPARAQRARAQLPARRRQRDPLRRERSGRASCGPRRRSASTPPAHAHGRRRATSCSRVPTTSGIRIHPVADVDEGGALVPIELVDPAGRPMPPSIEIA